jgi:hypothetical protein
MITASQPPELGRSRQLYFNCPRCGLSIAPRRRWLRVEHCPRCLARSRTPVALFTSTLPCIELYPPGRAPDDTHVPGRPTPSEGAPGTRSPVAGTE